jgi:uncharacterized protein
MMKKMRLIIVPLALVFLLMIFGCSSVERRLLFYPTHRGSTHDDLLTPWTNLGQVIGFSRTVESPGNVWLMFHGNAGQASDRTYALASFSAQDSVFILEYPGFGKRGGVPTMESLRSAATEAYHLLRRSFPKTPVCVVGESIGTGPASFLATLDPPPDKVVLIAPFDNLLSVAKDHFPGFLVSLLLTHKWDNSEALSHYKGPVQIFAAARDTIIRPQHARALASTVTNSSLVLIDGGHNDWSLQDRVKIRNP